MTSKTPLQRLAGGTLTALILASLTTPLSAFAEEQKTLTPKPLRITTASPSPETSPKPSKSPKAEAEFCTNLTKKVDQIVASLAKEKTTLNTKRKEDDGSHSTKRKEVDTSLTSKRAELTEKRDTQFTKLEEKYSATASQKAAVTAFEQAVKDAIATHRASVDATILIARQGIDQEATRRRSLVDQAVATFTNAVTTDATTAKADCAAGVAPATIRQTFTTSLQNDRSTLETSRQQIQTDSKAKLDAIKATSRTSRSTADAIFKAAIKKAQEALQVTLKA